MAFEPRRRLLTLHREPLNRATLEQLSLAAEPNQGETARALLPPRHTVRIAIEKREFEEKREKDRQEHAKKFRYVMNELKYVYDLNWTWRLFPSHVLLRITLLKDLDWPLFQKMYFAKIVGFAL